MRKTIVTSEVIVLGRQGEDGANKVLFPVRGWKELYGDGQFVVTALRPDENDPYPVTTHIYEENDGFPVTRHGVFVEWIVGSADVEIPGRGKVELAYYTSDDVRVKSVVYHTVIYDALGQNSLTPPEPWESWVEDVREAGADAIQAAEDAAESAGGAAQAADDAQNSAADASQYANSASDSAADASQYAENARQSAENAATAVSDAFGQITATADTLSPGSSATASFNPSTKVMNFGIPKGDTGAGATDLKEIPLTYSGGQYWIASADDGKWIVDNTPAVNGEAIIIQPFVLRAGSRVFYPVGISINGGGGRGLTAVCHDYNIMLPNGTFREMLYSCSLSAAGVCSTPGYERRALETEGKITIGASMYSAGTKYAVERKALAITENGVTTTYYVADITNT